MNSASRLSLFVLVNLCFLLQRVVGEGVMLMYRPRDVSNECAQSYRLRYDVSFGMGMSDTITLVFRTLTDVDYECTVEIATNEDIFLLIVIKFPNKLLDNCLLNRDAIKVIKKNKCASLCELISSYNARTRYFKAVVRQRFRFQFTANSSINANLNAHVYQVTTTAARTIPDKAKCQNKNETTCVMSNQRFCFTSGVVCDGIKNCGATDWYDERKAGCGLPIEKLSATAVVAVIAAMLLALLAVGHFIAGCLPPLANSFFIFNANEDNRLCLDPVLKPFEQKQMDLTQNKRISLIPVFSSSSEDDLSEQNAEEPEKENMQLELTEQRKRRMTMLAMPNRKNTTIQNMTAKIQEKFRLVTGRRESSAPRSGNQSPLELQTIP